VEVNSALAEDAGNPDTVLFPEQPPVVTSGKWSWTVDNELIDFRVALEHSSSMSWEHDLETNSGRRPAGVTIVDLCNLLFFRLGFFMHLVSVADDMDIVQ